MATPATRRFQLGSLLLGVSGFCMLLMFLPYKRYSMVSFFGAGKSDGSESVFSLLGGLFSNSFDLWAVLITLPFLAIFSPFVILAELGSLRSHAPRRALFLVQGIPLLCSAPLMLWIMRIDVLEYDVKLLPTFYGVLCWVIVPPVFSFILVSRQVQNGLRRFIA